MKGRAMIDIRPWGRGGAFYRNPVNVFGVLLTVSISRRL
jgi:hypothetical protein